MVSGIKNHMVIRWDIFVGHTKLPLRKETQGPESTGFFFISMSHIRIVTKLLTFARQIRSHDSYHHNHLSPKTARDILLHRDNGQSSHPTRANSSLRISTCTYNTKLTWARFKILFLLVSNKCCTCADYSWYLFFGEFIPRGHLIKQNLWFPYSIELASCFKNQLMCLFVTSSYFVMLVSRSTGTKVCLINQTA